MIRENPLLRDLVLGTACFAVLSCVAWVAAPSGVNDPRITFVILAILAWVSATDLRSFEIPDIAVAILVFLACWQIVVGSDRNLASEIAVALVATGALWIGSELYFRRRGVDAFGIGDAKLVGALCLLLGPTELPTLLLAASLGGICYVVVARIFFSQEIEGAPFAPFLSVSAAWLYAMST